MSNMAPDGAMRAEGIDVIRTRVGDRYVISTMRENGLNLGGEQSGHLIFLITTQRETESLGTEGACIYGPFGCPLSELARIFEPYPQVKVDVSVLKSRSFDDSPAAEGTRQLQDGARKFRKAAAAFFGN